MVRQCWHILQELASAARKAAELTIPFCPAIGTSRADNVWQIRDLVADRSAGPGSSQRSPERAQSLAAIQRCGAGPLQVCISRAAVQSDQHSNNDRLQPIAKSTTPTLWGNIDVHLDMPAPLLAVPLQEPERQLSLLL